MATIQENEMDNEKHSPTRRAVIGRAALGLTAGAALDGMSPALALTDRKTFVLVHGSSAGGWCYRRVAALLERRGHKEFAPPITGLCGRYHLLTGKITLGTHITDGVNVIRREHHEDFVLRGHSYVRCDV